MPDQTQFDVENIEGGLIALLVQTDASSLQYLLFIVERFSNKMVDIT